MKSFVNMPKLELIETLWNVNLENPYGINPEKYELIETLWNVNIIFPILDNGIFRINRNIVECK